MEHRSSSCSLSPYTHIPYEEEFYSQSGTFVHPTSLIGKDVVLEENVKIGPFCIISGSVLMKAGSKIYGHCTIGLPAQDTGTHKSLGHIEIGSGSVIREFVSIHASKYPNGLTTIGERCYIMNYSHIAHDVTLGESVILINNVNIGGHASIGHHVMLMANSAVHQFCSIGEYTCLTPYSATRQDLPPFCMFTGQPAQFSGLNKIGLRRAALPQNSLDAIKQISYLFYQEKLPFEKIKEHARAHKEGWGGDTYVERFIAFIDASKRGVSRRSFSYAKTTFYEPEHAPRQTTIRHYDAD